jgi:hypothetical protein
MSSRSRAARLAAAGLAASAIAVAPAGALAQPDRQAGGPPQFPASTQNSITAATLKTAGPPVFPTSTQSSATGTSVAQRPAASQTTAGVSALGIVAISLGTLVLGFGAALVLDRRLSRRVARA